MIGTLLSGVKFTGWDDQGVIAPGGLLHVYAAGTPSTPVDTFYDEDLAVGHENTNPVVLDASGRATIYLTPGVGYYFVFTLADGTPVWSQDHVTAIGASGAGGAADAVSTNDLRLTLQTGVPVSVTDQAAKTSVYWAPHRGNLVALYDASGLPTTVASAQVFVNLPAVASQVYDIFAYPNLGVAALELLAWTNDTTRAVPLVQTTTGTWTKSGDLTRRYLGTVRTTSVAGQTEDSTTKRFLWNAYHGVARPLVKQEATATWTYTLATHRQANGAPANKVELVVGLAEALLDLSLRSLISNTSAGVGTVVSIGEDTITVPAVGEYGYAMTQVVNQIVPSGLARLRKYPAAGYHYYSWLEYSLATGVTTWYGTVALGSTLPVSGLVGAIDKG